MSDNKILFVCNTNTLFSPAAEAIFQKKSREKGLGDYYKIDSAGLTGNNEGEFPELKIMRLAHKRGYNLTHRARKIRDIDLERYDYILPMNNREWAALLDKTTDNMKKARIIPLVDFCKNNEMESVPQLDSYDEKALEKILEILEDACEGLLEYLITQESYS